MKARINVSKLVGVETGKPLAMASVVLGIDDAGNGKLQLNDLQVREGEKGVFVTTPSVFGKDEKFYPQFELTGDVKGELSSEILNSFFKLTDEKKSISKVVDLSGDMEQISLYVKARVNEKALEDNAVMTKGFATATLSGDFGKIAIHNCAIMGNRENDTIRLNLPSRETNKQVTKEEIEKGYVSHGANGKNYVAVVSCYSKQLNAKLGREAENALGQAKYIAMKQKSGAQEQEATQKENVTKKTEEEKKVVQPKKKSSKTR